MIVVDSSVWIDWFNRSPTRQVLQIRLLADTDQILVGDLILIEVLQGARNDLHAARIERFLRQFHHVTLSTPQLAPKAAQNYRILRSLGQTVRKTIDVVIATYCIENGHHLLHEDRDFEPFRPLGLLEA